MLIQFGNQKVDAVKSKLNGDRIFVIGRSRFAGGERCYECFLSFAGIAPGMEFIHGGGEFPIPCQRRIIELLCHGIAFVRLLFPAREIFRKFLFRIAGNAEKTDSIFTIVQEILFFSFLVLEQKTEFQNPVLRNLVRKIAIEIKIVWPLHGTTLKSFGKRSPEGIDSARRERVDNPENLSCFFLLHFQFQFPGKEISFQQAFSFRNNIKCHSVQIMIKIPAALEIS